MGSPSFDLPLHRPTERSFRPQKRNELEQAGGALQAFASTHTQGKLGITIG